MPAWLFGNDVPRSPEKGSKYQLNYVNPSLSGRALGLAADRTSFGFQRPLEVWESLFRALQTRVPIGGWRCSGRDLPQEPERERILESTWGSVKTTPEGGGRLGRVTFRRLDGNASHPAPADANHVGPLGEAERGILDPCPIYLDCALADQAPPFAVRRHSEGRSHDVQQASRPALSEHHTARRKLFGKSPLAYDALKVQRRLMGGGRPAVAMDDGPGR